MAMWRNPYSQSGQRDEPEPEPYSRQQLLDALNSREPTAPPIGRPRSVPTPEQRQRITTPGYRTSATPSATSTSFNDPARTADQLQLRDPESGRGPRAAGDYEYHDAPATPPPATPPAVAPTTAGLPRNETRTRQLGAEILDEYDDPYQRRGGYGGSDPGRQAVASALLSSGNPYGWAAGAMGYLDAWFHRRAKTAPTDLNLADAQQILRDFHTEAFGREITDAYLDEVLRAQGWEPGDRYVGQEGLSWVLGELGQNAGQEYQGRIDRGEITPDGTPVAPPADTAAPATAAAGGPSPYAMEGFNLARAQDPAFSAKDAFAAAVRAAGTPPPGEDKAALGAWFEQHIAPAMEAQGHTINWVNGDQMNFTSPQGTFTVDWYRGAGAPGGALAWQVQGADGGGGGGAGGGGSGRSGATSIQEAYAWLKQHADPTWSRAEMESAIAAAFGEVPGFEQAYAGDVVINGRKLDLITNFEGADPSWSDNLTFQPLHPAGGGAAPTTAPGLTDLSALTPGVELSPLLGQSDVNRQIQAALQRLIAGAPDRDALLTALGG